MYLYQNFEVLLKMKLLQKLSYVASRGIFICTRCYGAFQFPSLSETQMASFGLHHSQNITKKRNDKLLWKDHIKKIRGYHNDSGEIEPIEDRKQQRPSKRGTFENFEAPPEDRSLYIEFSGMGITNDDVRALSKDINHYSLKTKASGQCFAKITFHTSEQMEEHYEKWQKEGYYVDYIGQRRVKAELETAPQTLRVYIKSPNITTEDLYSMSKDIIYVRMKISPWISSIAYIRFESEEKALSHRQMFEACGMRTEHMGSILKANEETGYEKQKLPRFELDHEENYIMSRVWKT